MTVASKNAPKTGAPVPDADTLPGRLEQRAPGRWELYSKSAESWERVTTASASRLAWRREEGLAARVWDEDGPRFVAGTSAEELLAALADAGRFAPDHEPPPDWPSKTATAGPPASADAEATERPPELHDDLARAVAEGGAGAALTRLALRSGIVRERVRNGGGLDVAWTRRELDGVATALGRRGERAGEVRVAFRGSQLPDLVPLARRLVDAAMLPLAEPSAPPPRGEWLLDPVVGAAILAAMSPIFTADRPPRWIARGSFASPDAGVADDASPDAPCDGEGVPSRRVLLVEEGHLVGGLRDLRTAKRAGLPSTGHGVRSSYRTPPSVGPRRIFFETSKPRPAAELLTAVKRGLYASALIAPPRIDLVEDRFEIEFTGIAVVAGRARGPGPAARAGGRLSELLRRIRALGTDLQFFPLPFASGAPTILVERATFE